MQRIEKMQYAIEYSEERHQKRTPSSKLTANSLFTFTTKLDYIESWLTNRCISARYCIEDIRYLRIGKPRISRIAFPMKCFCDINIHNLGEHLDWYGYFGLGFSKEWGEEKGIQPIQYINEKSALGKEYREAFRIATKDDAIENKKMRDYIAAQLVFFKPCSGTMQNRNTGKVFKKCFTDESEWRFVPDVSSLGVQQVITKKSQLLDVVLGRLSNSLMGIPEASITFIYQDIKYIIVESKNCLSTLIDCIDALNLSQEERDHLVSKILIWDEIKEDL